MLRFRSHPDVESGAGGDSHNHETTEKDHQRRIGGWFRRRVRLWYYRIFTTITTKLGHRSSLVRMLIFCFLGVVIGSLVLTILYGIVWTFKHFQCYTREAGVVWEEGPTHDLHRPCPAVNYSTASSHRHPGKDDDEPASIHRPKICITTLTDEQSPSLWQRAMRCRNFDQVGHLTWPNRQAYAEKHGYTLIDYSDHIDSTRPPAWSKIKAVQSLLKKPNNNHDNQKDSPPEPSHDCDWIFWMDADTLIMNSTIPIESFLPRDDDKNDKTTTARTHNNIDLIVTTDRRFTANSGAWLIRADSEWSHSFLQEWWDMRGWVREPGLSLSGDNAAFGHLVNAKLQKQEQQQPDSSVHPIAMVPRCTFNSFGVYLDNTAANELREHPDRLSKQEWYNQSPNFYYKGDFMAHASGIDQKEAGIQMLLKRAQ